MALLHRKLSSSGLTVLPCCVTLRPLTGSPCRVSESISGAPRETAAEQQAYDLLRAHGHHQKPAGKDYWFWQQRLEKRSAEVGGRND